MQKKFRGAGGVTTILSGGYQSRHDTDPRSMRRGEFIGNEG
ncbi:hypothetical protein RRSWK_03533 [Rhodopirellula sp. SWK7]|nr:hypothetical protein RRSWK_03533 [Rhodopirellula sp. SWK7]